MTKIERQLVKRLGAAYAFVWDLRQAAVSRADVYNIRLTAGIDQAIAQAEEQYPRVFRRHFSSALKKAQIFRETQAQAQAARAEAAQKTVDARKAAKQKATPRRKKAPPPKKDS